MQKWVRSKTCRRRSLILLDKQSGSSGLAQRRRGYPGQKGEIRLVQDNPIHHSATYTTVAKAVFVRLGAQRSEKCLRVIEALVRSGSEFPQIVGYRHVLVIGSRELATAADQHDDGW